MKRNLAATRILAKHLFYGISVSRSSVREEGFVFFFTKAVHRLIVQYNWCNLRPVCAIQFNLRPGYYYNWIINVNVNVKTCSVFKP